MFTTDKDFLEAVRRGDTNAVLLYLDADGDPEVTDADGNGALALAIRHGHDAIAEILADHGAAVDAAPANQNLDVLQILPRTRDSEIPLSFAQEGLWFLEQYGGQSAAHNMPEAFALRGTLDRHVLELSLGKIISRHESLRSTFHHVDGRPYQTISKNLSPTLTFRDLRDMDAGGRTQAVEHLIASEAQVGFDLQADCLIRAQLLQVANDEYVLLVTLHHIVCDGWSTGILFWELAENYNACIAGATPALPELPVQYPDFAIAQRRSLEGPLLANGLEYWTQRLDGHQDLELPSDRPRPPLQTMDGANEPFRVSVELTRALQRVAADHQASLFTVMLSAFYVLLQRYAQQDDIVVGVPVANRHHPGTEGLIGLFVNVLPLRALVLPDRSFGDFLKEITQHTLDAYEHQDVPLDRIVEALRIPRDPSRSPLFQVTFGLHRRSEGAQSLPALDGLLVSRLEVPCHTAQFDMSFDLEEGPDGIDGRIEYSTRLFSAERVRSMAQHYEVLLGQIANDSRTEIRRLKLVSAHDMQRLVERNATAAEYRIDATIHQLFEEQVARTPESIALVLDDARVTYRELNAMANRIAHALRSRYRQKWGRELPPDTLIALSVDRGFDMIAALLGALKAGGAYVPLDPAYPEERLDYMLRDSDAPYLLTERKYLRRWSGYAGEVICLDAQDGEIADADACNPTPRARSRDLAYVLYTSGSTGRPKGVMLEHQGLCNIAEVGHTVYGVTSSSRVLQAASMSFDVAVEDWAIALVRGASLVLVKAKEELLGHRFADICLKHQVTFASLTPAHLDTVPLNVELPDLKTLAIGGDAAETRLLQAWANKGVTVFNIYGATEATIDSVVLRYESRYSGSIIGRPLPNNTAYVLDESLEPCPEGVVGELFLGGVGLARGYLNRPDLTKEKFIPNPFAGQQGPERGYDAVLYRTGDFGCWLPDGNLEFHGRRDHQVKIRGFRVELDEIATALRQHDAIKDAVVVLREDRPGDKALVAYLTLYGPAGIDSTESIVAELRKRLEGRLPEHMIPSAVVILDSLPLSPNGKFDRGALPRPSDHSIFRSARVRIPPRTVTERNIACAWADLLQLKEIGIDDNFFTIGGHSLLVIRMIAKLKTLFGYDVSITDCFSHPTIRQVAQHVQRNSPAGLSDSVLPIQTDGSERPLFLVAPAGGPTAYLPLAPYLESQPVYGIGNSRFTSPEAAFESVEEMARDCMAQMKRIQPNGPYRIGGWSFGGVVAFEMGQQLLGGGDHVESLILLDAYNATDEEPESADVVDQHRRDLEADYAMESPEVRALLIAEHMHVIRLMDAYHANPFPGHVALLKATGGGAGLSEATSVHAPSRPPEPDDNRWARVCADLQIFSLPCGHFDLFRPEHVATTAATLRKALMSDGE